MKFALIALLSLTVGCMTRTYQIAPIDPELLLRPVEGAVQTHPLAEKYRLIDDPDHRGHVRFPTPGTRVPVDHDVLGPVHLVVYGKACALESGGYLIMMLSPCVEPLLPEAPTLLEEVD